MIRPSELELHARAKELFERENLGRLWRVPNGASVNLGAHTVASLIERQIFLSRVRAQMRAEGAVLITEDESLSGASSGRNYVLPQL